ncbi:MULTISPECIES: lytic transglycosylase domain-containing protein [Methylosinus]|uniref:Lytic transglycosylase n=1 Tax=Methylosinus trichosporium (strain ATCC 35070 / NCIMB 11131 / UNIQEM 75 / OB3b) TaxID=595536 RepID=A0A2D2D186_METT3|nr:MULTISPECIES: lytic transglycosylase domain-containing protein [Methylosinus]ATQ68761.1 lytic transglycosylase [Methylosinus trichosporium OB3b]OBS53077.1 lytic transglycosylase [Methylosinus sp. 3S-1]
MSKRFGGAARLFFCLSALGAAASVYSFSTRRAPERPGDAAEPTTPRAAGSAREALGGFAAPRADSRESPATLAYAPPDGGLAAEPPAPDPAALLGADLDAFNSALAAYKAGDFAGGDAALAAVEAPLARMTAQWAGLRLHPREAGFARLSRFLAEHPSWPAADWLRQRVEEALYGDRHPDSLIDDYFAARPPRTPAGKLALARLRARQNQPLEVAALIKPLWRDDDFNEALETTARKEFSQYLDAADHKYRADRLLYAGKTSAALRIAAHAGADVLDLARARALAANGAATEKSFAAVPAALQRDPGLVFARVYTLRHQKKFVEAATLLRAAPRDPAAVVDGDAWWVERRLLARKMLDLGRPAEAYELCAGHAARALTNRVEAEFHAGWIALRFLDNPGEAEQRFETIVRVAETPLQKSRGAYWLGRAREAKGTPEAVAAARAAFEIAALQSTTFYGQLARERLGLADSPLRPAPAPAVGEARDEAVRAVELLFALDERALAAPLASDAAKTLTSDAQVAALAAVAERRRDAKVSLTLGKLASYRGFTIDDAAFPAFGIPAFTALPGSASRSIVYAIARQESAFDPKAVSSAGAMGLMQMIESTARQTARQTGVGFDVKRMIAEPAFNARLGAAHLGLLLGEHKGSYILTFAAYNAGGKRVKEWIDAYGDPRRKDVDPVDWVERIPITETRNYVQRVMENLVVYRAKFDDRDLRSPQSELARM